MQESRYFKIIYYLIENGFATAFELAEKFEVSVRTIYRDLDSLSSAGIPIYTTQGKGGGISILPSFTLDKSLFSLDEREKIVAAMQGILATEGKNTDALLTKLGALFQVKTTNWIEVDFSNWVHRTPQENYFNLLKEAILGKRVIHFIYYNPRKEKSVRKVEPLKLVFKSKDWYLYAFCLERQDFRFFKLTRMRDLEIISETFIPKETPLILDKTFHEEKVVLVKLKFDKTMAFRVYDEFLEEITEDSMGNLYVETKLPDNELLESYLFSFFNHVEVLEPIEVRERMQKKLEEMLKKYIT